VAGTNAWRDFGRTFRRGDELPAHRRQASSIGPIVTACCQFHLILPYLDSSTEAATLRDRVARGELGAKAGRGFLSWSPDRVLGVKKRVAGALMRG
jgi:hypothetical protein